VTTSVERTGLHPGVKVLPAQGRTTAVAVLLHGGKADSYEESEPKHFSSLRMRPFARAIHAQGAKHGVAVWRVRYRVRGWNGPERSPVADARWALDEVRRRHGDVPVVLVGHSMGGRTAVHVLGDPNVVAIVALAPWLPHEPVAGATGRDVLVAHGVVDRWTSRRARLWTDLAVGWTLTSLGLDPSVGRTATNVLVQAAAGAPLLKV
jgi:dienelactone hydrolase